MKGRSTVMQKGPDRLEGLKVELGRTTERVEVDDRILRRFGTGLVKLANRPYRALAVCERRSFAIEEGAVFDSFSSNSDFKA
ncbi:hypothetical protein FA13DRAFT_1733093 [Coprinellus micaceus]|uniref:Uncharacterized protein n=1 Tax=Coprinellus micaceus TaxID=71717 RepID=A0A4Y7TAG4_COPMI|nr:hypothetical protein FA13DRAFT_1733093 [Coprinellus micaceus]